MKQQLGKVSITPKGEWNSATAYECLDTVNFGGGSWLAKRANTAVSPVEGDDWMQLSAKGADAEVTKDSIVEALGYEPEKSQGDYVLIEEFTLTEDMEKIDRSQEPNGTAYKFDAAVVTTEYSSWTAVARYVVFNSKNDGKGYNLTTGVSQTMAALQARAYKHGNLWYCFCCHGSTSDVSNIRGQASTQTFSTTSNIDAIRYISIRGTFYADTKIKIYAVRA